MTIGGREPERLRELGVLQAKLITANPRMLLSMYEAFPIPARVPAKRALVQRLVGALDIGERDPTHEVLDVAINHVSTVLSPLSGSLRSWWSRVTLDTIANGREPVLAATAQLARLFSDETRRRLALFRQLFGKSLRAPLTEATVSLIDGRPPAPRTGAADRFRTCAG